MSENNLAINETQSNGMFNVIIPKPFSISEFDSMETAKLKDEVIDKIRSWENRMNEFFNDYQVFADSWRVRSRKRGTSKSGLYNSKSGETHRAAETLGTFWLRSLTATDPYFEATGEGLDDFGNEIEPGQLYATERVISKQLQVSHFKEKLMRSLRSVALFGTGIFEEPFVRIPHPNGRTWFEYTDFVFRSILKTAFDTSVWDINMSDYIATIDFPTKYMLRRLSRAQGEYWDNESTETIIDDQENLRKSSIDKATSVYQRVQESKQRAGYTDIDINVLELISYHGKIDINNPIVGRYWESEGRQDDPSDFDFTLRVLNAESLVSFHETPFGTWHSRFKVAHFKTFEDESIGYGAGRIGRKGQREIDIQLSRTQDTLMKGVYSMYLVGRYAGIKANQWGINPNGLIEVEDVDQVRPLPIDVSTIAQALAMVANSREEFRATVGAMSNLQAQITKASATESAIAGSEASRYASVHAEIISETFLREHIETMHYNNLEYLDEPIWVAASGENKPGYYDKRNLPMNIGIIIKVVTDKDFRPERIVNILKGMELGSSIRNIFDPETGINLLKVLSVEYFRALGIDPRLLTKPVSVGEQMKFSLQRMANRGMVPNEVEGELASEASGGVNTAPDGSGPVPNAPDGLQGMVQGI